MMNVTCSEIVARITNPQAHCLTGAILVVRSVGYSRDGLSYVRVSQTHIYIV